MYISNIELLYVHLYYHSRGKQKLQRDRKNKNRRRPRPQQSATEKADFNYDNFDSSAVSATTATTATGTTAPDVGSSDLVSRYVLKDVPEGSELKIIISCIYGSSHVR